MECGENYDENATMFLLDARKDLQITPSGVINIIDLRVLGYCLEDP